MSNFQKGLLLRPAVIAPLLCIIYAIFLITAYGDSLVLVTLGQRFAPNELANRLYSEEGYDGQFGYYLARYGSDGAQYIDIPAYRGQRILLTAFARILSFGQSEFVVWSMFATNILALAIGTYLLEQLLMHYKVSRWYALGYALSLGVFGAARLNTTEALAYAFVTGGILLMQKERWKIAALTFALAILSKETTIFFPAAYGIYLLYQRRTIQALIFGILVLLPFTIWQLALFRQFGTFGIGSGGGGATGFEVVPFMGFLRILTEGGLQIFIVMSLLVGLFVIVPALWALWRVYYDSHYSFQVQSGLKPQSTLHGWTMMTGLLLANAFIMPFIPFSTYREPLGILRFIVGLQIAIILYAAERRNRRTLMYSTLWFITTFFVIISDIATIP